ncbi:MAG: DUF4878 domain-containing protein [Clostridiales bacterium]|jgi:hypothetical protein|nr:DUF4878 domain-containing protein [Clostridiales bacterium]
MKKLKLVLAALTIAVCAAALLACNANGSPKSVFNAYLAAVNAGDYKKAAACMYPKDSDEYKVFVAAGEAAEILAKAAGESMKPDKKMTAKNFTVTAGGGKDDTTATATVTLTTDGADTERTFKFKKTDGKWYIDLVGMAGLGGF